MGTSSSTINNMPIYSLDAIVGAGRDEMPTDVTTSLGAEYGYIYTGWSTSSSSYTWSRKRGSRIYKRQENLTLPTSSTYVLWSPNSGKKVRLMGISVASDRGGAVIQVRMGGGTILDIVFPTGGGVYRFEWGEGVLAANIGDTVTIANETGGTGKFYASAFGIEE
jgi:hypothetical protein